jgi:7-cyano-7-deazaguanine reductase
MPTSPSKTLKTFPNPEPQRDYIIEIEAPEFTCLCPKTGQPDFATLRLEYIADRLCLELKSLKLYIWSFRNEGHFHEKVTNLILNDLVAAIQPRYMRVRAAFNVRGGLHTTVTAEYRKSGWEPLHAPLPNLPRGRQQTIAGPEAETAGARAASTSVASSPAGVEPADTAPVARGSRSDRFRMLKRNRAAAAAAAASATAPPTAPPPPPAPARDVYIGIDLGTSGCRVVAIDAAEKVLAQAESPLPAPLRFEGQVTQDPNEWWKAVSASLKQVLNEIDAQRVHRIGVAGTSGTLLLCDKHGGPVTPGLMYNDRRAEAEAERIAGVADDRSAANDVCSSLAKLLWLHGKKSQERAAFALHQADWIGNRLTGVYGHSDYHNSLKLGYDPAASRWPGWFAALEIQSSLLPEVHTPGEPIGTVSADIANAFGLSAQTEIVAGTTDGVAAFLAAGASKPGHGVTVLGNTLVIKLLSEKQIVSQKHGVYSHRLGRYWLAGGASNSGGAVLLQFFTVDQLREMTPLLDPERSTELHYYPLPDVGERFPINDPHMPPKLEPLPSDSLMFLQGILEGIARIEAQGYNVLLELGAPKITAIWTSGSGSQNPAWTSIRERVLGARLTPAKSHSPAVGAAMLAAGVLQRAFA